MVAPKLILKNVLVYLLIGPGIGGILLFMVDLSESSHSASSSLSSSIFMGLWHAGWDFIAWIIISYLIGFFMAPLLGLMSGLIFQMYHMLGKEPSLKEYVTVGSILGIIGVWLLRVGFTIVHGWKYDPYILYGIFIITGGICGWISWYFSEFKVRELTP